MKFLMKLWLNYHFFIMLAIRSGTSSLQFPIDIESFNSYWLQNKCNCNQNWLYIYDFCMCSFNPFKQLTLYNIQVEWSERMERSFEVCQQVYLGRYLVYDDFTPHLSSTGLVSRSIYSHSSFYRQLFCLNYNYV